MSDSIFVILLGIIGILFRLLYLSNKDFKSLMKIKEHLADEIERLNKEE